MPGLSVVVGVLTFRRPLSLEALLPQLLDQLETLDPEIRGEILVVDNDPEGSAAPVATGRDPRIRYVGEPTPGIAAARQRCLDESSGFDLLQFIDDDEEPQGDWLRTMIDAWRTHGRPAGVAGRVIPRYAAPPSDWIAAGEFFVRRRRPSGTPLPAAPSGNLLLDLNQIRALQVRFDPTLGLSGGEDTLFTRQVVGRGGRIVFCDDAAVTDLVPADRMTRSWVLRRAWFHGSTAAEIRLRNSAPRPRWLTRTILVVGGVGRTGIGLASAAAGTLTRNLRSNALGWQMAYRGLGFAARGLGLARPEYGRTKEDT